MTEPSKCRYCGAELHEGASFCLYCMHTLSEKKEIPAVIVRRRKLLWISILFLLCILAAVVVFYFCYRDGSSQNLSDDKTMVLNSDHTQPESVVSNLTETIRGTIKESESTEINPIETESISTVASTTTDPTEISTTTPEGENNTEQTEPTVTKPNTENTDIPTDPQETGTVISCTHSYSKATCIVPQTCRLCGDIKGDASQDGHNWIGRERTVYHTEVGHWEDVEVLVKENRYLCFYCGYNQDGYVSYDALRDHMKVHSNKSDYQYVLSKLQSLSDVREVWVPVRETQWVVDQEAHTETITEYTCSYCGKAKS